MASFVKATKSQAKLRCALFGPSGSGKTYSALRIATGMGGKIAVIDTEHGSASKYADKFTFDTSILNDDQSIDAYIAALKEAGKAGYGVVIVDSLSHGWQELLAEIDVLTTGKYRGNKWAAWSEGTPKQKRLVEAILSYPGHLIATMRSKTAWEADKDERTGKVKPVRIGLAPEERAGIEYEFDLLLELSVNHIAEVIKDRTGKFQDKMITKPDEEFGKELAAWLSDGVSPAEPPTPAFAPAPQVTAPDAEFTRKRKELVHKIAATLKKPCNAYAKLDAEGFMERVEGYVCAADQVQLAERTGKAQTVADLDKITKELGAGNFDWLTAEHK